MLNIKKMVSALLGVTMVANMALIMPAFADETTGCTYAYDGYEVTYDVTNSWGVTEMVSITLSNTSDETIENWMLYFDPNGEITGLFDAQQATTSYGTTYYRNSGYNADVAPNASVTFSYTVDNCEEVPSDFTLCQTRSDKTEGYGVSLQVNQTWGDDNEYFNGEIILENTTDEPIEAWELTIDTNFTITEITNSWAATVTELEPYNYLLKGTYTGTVAANSNVSLGFIGVRDGEAEIIDYSLTEVVVDEDIINDAVNSNSLYNACIDWSELPDSDGDGLPDEFEEEYGCDPLNADSDGDGLPDGYEILKIGSDPANAYSLDTILSDGEYDNDQDGLCNYQEYLLVTDPILSDSDFDGLTDGDELNAYGTDPLNADTDEDGLSDGDEIALGLNPLVSDTDGDGVPDNEEMFNQSKTFEADEDDTVVQQIDVAFEGTGYIDSTTSVESVMDVDWMCSNVVGLIGDPYDISSDSTITEGTLTFHVTADALGESSFDNLAVLWYNETEQRFEKMETVLDAVNSTLTVAVNHFSKYLIVDCSRWYEAWSESYYPESSVSLHAALTIDCSDSMNLNDKQDEDGDCYRKLAATGFIEQMDENDMSSLIFFHEDAILIQALTGDKTTLKDALNRMFSNGYTNYDSALEAAYDSLDLSNNADSENIIIFISDGVPTDNNGVATDFDVYSNTYIQSAIENGVRIYTVGLTKSADQTVLKDIADITGGEYFYAATAEELVPYFLTISMGEKYDLISDTDGDSIPDLFETYGMPIANGQVIFTDAYDSDVDDDGLTDGEEIIMRVVDDEEEVHNAYKYMYDHIPEVFISDNGGIYFELITDPTNEDTDGDGISDYDEVQFYETDPNEEDTDGDGISDGVEGQNLDKLHPTVKDTIYSLYPDLSDPENKANQVSDAVYVQVEKNSNNVIFNIRYTFDEYADSIAIDYLNYNQNDQTMIDICDRLGKSADSITLRDLVLDGIKYRWLGNQQTKTFLGSEFDFYPGLDVFVTFNFIPCALNESESHYVKFKMDPTKAGASYNTGDNDGNTIFVMTTRFSTDSKKSFTYYEGTAGHEFGHTLGLPDAYPGVDIDQSQNNGFSCATNNSNDEIYLNADALLSYPNAGEIMWVNGSAVANDIEMLLFKHSTGEAQRFTFTYDTPRSAAIRQNIGYLYTNKYEGISNQPYSMNQRYEFISEKGYIPLNIELKTINMGDYELLYYDEEISGVEGVSIYGLSNSFSGLVTIPDTIDGKSVIKISDGAFMNSAISSITLPDSIVTIGQRAFYECSNLQAITIPNNVEVIRPYTFFGCSALNTIISPDNLKYVAINACEGCAITSFYFPADIKYIYANAFNDCDEISAFTVEDGNEFYYSDNGVLFYNNTSDNVGTLQVELLCYPRGKTDSSYTIPDEVNIIGDSAFINSDNLESVNFNANLTLIKGGAFNNCDLLNNLDIPETVSQIYSYAFYSCSSLSNVKFRKSSPEGYANNIFWASDSNLSIYVPLGTLLNYTGWPYGGNITYHEIEEED